MSKLEGRLNHQKELKRHLANIRYIESTRRWTIGGWSLMAIWGIWVVVSYIIS